MQQKLIYLMEHWSTLFVTKLTRRYSFTFNLFSKVNNIYLLKSMYAQNMETKIQTFHTQNVFVYIFVLNWHHILKF